MSQTNQDTVRLAVAGYFKALNAGDANAVVALYTDDAVIMPQNMPSIIGKQTIQETYGNFLGQVSFQFTFVEDEAVASDHWAFVRTTSEGTLTPKEGGAARHENNRELFVLRKQDDGSWKIARYIYNNIAAN